MRNSRFGTFPLLHPPTLHSGTPSSCRRRKCTENMIDRDSPHQALPVGPCSTGLNQVKERRGWGGSKPGRRGLQDCTTNHLGNQYQGMHLETRARGSCRSPPPLSHQQCNMCCKNNDGGGRPRSRPQGTWYSPRNHRRVYRLARSSRKGLHR